MKIAIRINSLHRIKQVFTQEIFTEQVVAYHAVRVPVTPNLSSKITGFLPVHCIHQLLKCRAFSKHKVPIKDWIYKWALELYMVLPVKKKYVSYVVKKYRNFLIFLYAKDNFK